MPVASEEAAILTALLPSSSAPISRSRASSSRLTMAGASVAVLLQPQHAGARGGGQRRLAAGEERRQQQADHDNDQARASRLGGHRSCRRVSRPGSAHLGGIDVVATKACADAARQDEGQLAALHLLVLGDQVHQVVGVRQAAGDVRQCGRQADRGKMRARRARRPACGEQARAGRRTRTPAPCRCATASPCSRRPEKPAAGFERMAEGVAEIEQRALAGLALVARDDRRP